MKRTPGKPLGKYPSPKDVARLTSRYKVDPIGGCWIYQGYLTPEGYGVFHIGKKSYKQHRVAFEVFVRQLAPGEEVHHQCRNRACGNPHHLVAETEAEHLLDTVRHRWIDVQIVGGPWDGTERSVNPQDPQPIVIEDKGGVHTYEFREGEYVYAGVRRKKSRTVWKVQSARRFNQATSNRKQRQLKQEQPSLYDQEEMCPTSVPAAATPIPATPSRTRTAPTATSARPSTTCRRSRKRKAA